MGMILEFYAVSPEEARSGDARELGVLVGSISINSAAASALLAPLGAGPLARLDFASTGPTGALFEASELHELVAWSKTEAIDPEMSNAVLDAVEEATGQQASLWIGTA